MGSPVFWWAFHMIIGPLTGSYCAFLLWLVYKDTTTLEYMDLNTASKKDKVI